VVGVLGRGIDVDLHLVDLAPERVVSRGVVCRDGLAHIAADLQRLVHREEEGVGAIDASFGDFLPVDVQRDRGALPRPPPSYVNSMRAWCFRTGRGEVALTS
jgi:hypothetical protein